MNDHLLAVLACWLVAGCGLAMFMRAKNFAGQCCGHGAVVTALMSLSVMALDHGHAAHVTVTAVHGGEFVSVASAKDYHLPSCPMLDQKMYFNSAVDAGLFGRKPCPYCLLQEANHDPAQQYEHYEGPDASE